MSEQLTSSVPYRLVFSQLSQLDEECQNMPPEQRVNLIRGPFGAFKVVQGGGSTPVPDATQTSPPDVLSGETQLQEVDGAAQQTLSSSDWLTSMPVDTLLHFILDPSQPDLLPFLNNIPDPSWNTDGLISNAPDALSYPTLLLPNSNDAVPGDGDLSDLIPYYPTTDPSALTASIPCTITTPTDGPLPKHATFLVQYFSTTIISYLTPIRHEKTPWHILFLPHARDCLALLSLGHMIDHAGMCFFHGILAISALSLAGVHQSDMWKEQGEAHRQQANRHREIMVRTAYDLPKKYKYKSVLMALQIMGLISTLEGDPATEEYYFLEAEKLIKLRGLGRKNSRKARLLHHCYAFERLMYESTCMRGIDFKYRSRVSTDIKSVSVVPYPEDSMAFRPPNWQNLDEEISSQTQSPESDSTDQNNEILGLSPDALYSKVSGLPKHWIILILHIVLLGKEKDAVEQSARSGTLQLHEFLSRAKTLERCINQHIVQAKPPHQETQAVENREALENMLEAIRHSLQIYFYRRIYEVNTSWLQDSVLKVRDCLLRCETLDPTCEMSGVVGLLWASFIASCEAEDLQVQESFSDWYKRAAKRTGMVCWLNSLELSAKLWDEKRNTRGTKMTWIDLLRQEQGKRQRTQIIAAA